MSATIGGSKPDGGRSWRRGSAGLALVLLVAAILTSCGGSDTGDRFTGGESLANPPQLVSENGVLRATLTAEEDKVTVSGREVTARTYNGQFMPPTLVVNPGDTIELTLVNELEHHTNIHFHGFHVSPSGNSDNIFLAVDPGTTRHYRVEIPTFMPPGEYWYHSHAHPAAEEQVLGGLSGIIVVDGLTEHLPSELKGITQRVFALKDLQVNREGAIPSENIDSDARTTRLVNGQLNPRVGIRPGETQLWRFANIGADIWYRLHVDGMKFHVIGEDGNPVGELWEAEDLILPPGKRYEVLVQGPPAGTYRLDTLRFNQGPDGDQYPKRTLATIRSAGDRETPAELPTTFVPFEDLSDVGIDRRRTIVFSEDPSTNRFFINGRQFDEDRVDEPVTLGTLEEWTVRNTSKEIHPFHIHVNDFQVMSINGRPYDAHGWQDTVPLPVGGEVVMRMQFNDFTGKYVFHCHILAHEDNGMMAVVNVEP
ncbi:MAG: multicopper oxidase family protein, partial [Actinomycetota bacterium]|nr:multicopper oxidase family protein [Actinomycetota bacterium]